MNHGGKHLKLCGNTMKLFLFNWYKHGGGVQFWGFIYLFFYIYKFDIAGICNTRNGVQSSIIKLYDF
jgi:hypothetical protein